MFTGGVKFYTSVVFLNTAVVVACHIYSWFLSMWWIESEYLVVYLSCVYICQADHVELPDILYLLCNVWYITCCPNEKKLCMQGNS